MSNFRLPGGGDDKNSGESFEWGRDMSKNT